MELKTISQVSKDFDITTRTLRYYETLNLIKSTKKDNYAYRVYNEDSILRLQQIIILRKLRIPLKQIYKIINNESARASIEVFKESISELTKEIKSLSTIKEILTNLIKELQKTENFKLNISLLSNDSVLEIIEYASFNKIKFKEEKSMEELKAASENLETLKNVRIVYLPPFTVASSHYIGENPEENAENQLNKFISENNLYELKPDARVFGFNHPNPSKERTDYGYEFWVTVPENMEVPDYITKKKFNGGLYAAHTIVLGNFNEWKWLSNWVNDSQKYNPNCIEDNGEYMGGLLEEHLNYIYNSKLNLPESDEHQLDLLFPVKLKN
jgi:DNA-binding transcriptional MerR regulator